MRPTDNIKNLIKQLNIPASAELDEKIHREISNALAETKSVGLQPSVWRIIMKSKLTKLTAAAGIIIAVLIGISRFGGSIDGASVAWADVQTAFLAQSWVHLKYDNGTESWYNLKTGDHCHKQFDSFVYIDQTNNLRQRYTPAYGKRIEEDRPTIYKDNLILPYEPKTSWDVIVGHWENTAKTRGSKYWDVKIETDILDGRNVVRFDIYYIDALGGKILSKQLWADPATKLPIQIKENLTAQEQKDQNREYITGIFSFPETGPHSIYDLGVPKDLPIAKDYDKTANPSIEEIIKTAKQYYEKFPKRCRAVIWQNDRESEIEVLWRDGEKICFNHYCNLMGPNFSKYHLELPATVEQILAWAKTQPPMQIYLDDGKKNYTRSYHPAFENLKIPKTRVTRSWFTGLPEKAHFIESQWEYMDQSSQRFTFIDDANDMLSKFIGIKTESGDIRRDYYVDPEHDYLQVRNIWWKLQNGRWEKEREYITTDMSQLTDGQWYITKRKLITYPNPEKGWSRGEYNYSIDITLFEQNEFPPDIFNGEKLLEGAEIETY